MSTRTLDMTDAMYDYYRRVTVRESEVLRGLRERTAGLRHAGMQISPEQGQFMRLLATLIGAERAVEVGTFTGYSSTCVAQALPDPPTGRLVCCDVNEPWTDLARAAWAQAGVADRVTLKLAPASETLADLIAGRATDEAGQPLPGPGAYDLAFIDADKARYNDYYEACLQLLRPGGVVMIDNVLWHGRIARPPHEDEDADTKAIRAINEHVFSDGRVQASMLPIGDGLTVAMKR